MKQSRLHSLIEVCCATVFGFALSVVVGQLWIYPMHGVHPSWLANSAMTGWFTLLSIVRGYFVRRVFNWLHHR